MLSSVWPVERAKSRALSDATGGAHVLTLSAPDARLHDCAGGCGLVCKAHKSRSVQTSDLSALLSFASSDNKSKQNTKRLLETSATHRHCRILELLMLPRTEG